MKKIFLIPFLCFNIAFAQDNTIGSVSPQSALEKLKSQNYDEALVDYLNLLNQDPKNELYNYNVGLCYINSIANKAKAIPYFEIATRKEKHEGDTYYYLGRAYQSANRFDDAITSFKKYSDDAKGTQQLINEVPMHVQHCMNAKELMKYPIDVTFQNLGKNINSEFNENCPFAPADETFLIYNTNRPEKNAVKNPNGLYNGSVYLSKIVAGALTKCTLIGSTINAGNTGMEVIGLNGNGTIMLLFNHIKGVTGGMYISYANAKGVFAKPERLDSTINTIGDEFAASISPDGSVIYFASNRKGSIGGKDIYISKKVAEGKWSAPINAGNDINTIYDEDFPSCSPDGKVLYFSSKGHTSMGGYDIFKANISEYSTYFSKPKNVGYPINTSEDDKNLRVSKNGKYCYMASSKNNSLGQNDIYKVTFNDLENDFSVVIGDFKTADNSTFNYSDAFITVNNSANNELVGNYLPNPTNGRFIVILPPGKYQMSVEVPGYTTVNKQIVILDKVSYQAEINMTVELTK